MNNQTMRDEFKEWANKSGYDIADTNFDGFTIFLNPMTRDLWKAWQASRQDMPEQDRLLKIIACCYQMLDAHDADAHILDVLSKDVLSNPELATEQQIHSLLPYRPEDAAAIEQRGYERGVFECIDIIMRKGYVGDTYEMMSNLFKQGTKT